MTLSIITIAFNNLNGLIKTLEIFYDKRFSDSIELVIIDGGSTDGTLEFLQSQSITSNWISEKDNGIYNAMNKGLMRAKGNYLWFLNSGDYALNKDVVFEILKVLESQPDAVYGDTLMVDGNWNNLGTRSEKTTRSLPLELNWKAFQMGMNVSHQSFIIKRSKALPYNENYKYVSDIDWMINCLKVCTRIVNLKSVIACFVIDGYSTRNRMKSNVERYFVLQKHYGFLRNFYNHLRILVRKIANSDKL